VCADACFEDRILVRALKVGSKRDRSAGQKWLSEALYGAAEAAANVTNEVAFLCHHFPPSSEL